MLILASVQLLLTSLSCIYTYCTCACHYVTVYRWHDCIHNYCYIHSIDLHICFYSAILVLYKVGVYKVYTNGIHVTIATYLHSTLQLALYRPIVLMLYKVCVYKASVAEYNNYCVCRWLVQA